MNSDYINCFEKCKTLLTNDPILQYPDFQKEFILTTDASNIAISGILSQGHIYLPGPRARIQYYRARASGYSVGHQIFPSLLIWPKI